MGSMWWALQSDETSPRAIRRELAKLCTAAAASPAVTTIEMSANVALRAGDSREIRI
jgi:hypothetical protein